MFDSWTTAAMAAELVQTVMPSRVQQVLAVDAETLALELYARGRRHYFLASADRQAPRLLLAGTKPRRGMDAPSLLLESMRKLVRGAALIGVSQPPWERILHLDFQHPSHGHSRLVAELIGRWANLVLLRPVLAAGNESPDSWRVMACVHTVRPAHSVPETGDGAVPSTSISSSARPIMPGALYQPPPLLRGQPPDALTAPQLDDLLAQAEPGAALWRTLVSGLQGLSPPVAREISWRATGDADARVAGVTSQVALLSTIADFADMVSSARWQPCVVVDAAETPIAFAPYPLAHRAGGDLGRLQPMDSISAAAERYFQHRQRRDGDPYAAARAGVSKLIDGVRERLQRRRAAIARELLPPAEIEALRAAGEWILALASQIKPRQDRLATPEEAGMDPILLDPALSPADNAARYFQRYRKARRAAAAAGPRLAEVDADLAYLAQLAADLALAGERGEIDAVAAALAGAGLMRNRTQSAATVATRPAGPRRFATAEGYPILVGRNARQNEQVTFDLAGPDDLWLHARGVPGSHVVIRSGGQPVGEATLSQAAGLAAFYSAAQAERWVDVIVVPRRRVRRAPGGRPGMVIVEGERVLRVRMAKGEGEKSTADSLDQE